MQIPSERLRRQDVQVKTGKEGQDAQTSGTEEKLSTDLVVGTGT